MAVGHYSTSALLNQDSTGIEGYPYLYSSGTQVGHPPSLSTSVDGSRGLVNAVAKRIVARNVGSNR